MRVFLQLIGVSMAIVCLFTAPLVVSETAVTEDTTTSVSVRDLPSGTYVLDKEHGYVVFSYSHRGFSKPILTFHKVDATLTLDAQNPSNSSVQASIDPKSVSSGVPIWDQRLQEERFFHSTEFPEISFNSTKIIFSDDNRGLMAGKMSIRGVTIPVTFEMILNKTGEHHRSGTPWLGVSAKATVNRSDWGMKYGVPLTSDEVEIRIEVEFGLQKEESRHRGSIPPPVPLNPNPVNAGTPAPDGIGVAVRDRTRTLGEMSADTMSYTPWADSDAIKPLPVGTKIPAASTVMTMDGEPFDLHAAVTSQPTVLIFYRRGWCPYCNAHLRELQQSVPALTEMGYQLLAISPDAPAELSSLEKDANLSYELLSDKDVAVGALSSAIISKHYRSA